MRLAATPFHALRMGWTFSRSPSAVTIRENIVTKEPGLEDSGNILLSRTPVFPVGAPGRVWRQ